MIRYPILKEGAVIGSTAPSSGVEQSMHGLIREAVSRLESAGFNMVVGDTVWTQAKAKSAPAKVRGEEFNRMLRDDAIDLIVPPWGGELLIEILEHLDLEHIPEKWILGYSDISLLLLTITLRTGLATAHGTNLVDLRGEYADDTTAMWHTVLSTKAGDSVLQHSSARYQKEWNHAEPSPCVFHLTEPTAWVAVSGGKVSLKGRLLGGCIDVIRHVIGTPYGDVRSFQRDTIGGEPVLWYLENCELNMADQRRSLVQMKLAGWFDYCSGLMFGRSGANRPVEGYKAEDMYRELAEELQVPIVYDIDCGHVPPQITLINGAYAEVEVENGQGKITQYFRP
ncbi:LD-carboxypeptidase [Paenibacillus sp. HJL G12]|uniref:LD-carboxypeptidase n=1 Tax=Paenibacillus dendrobii TaxID=2691084 RepID=A0A7X3IQL2_9BACL|nr:S66 peptidase family protein [Paenibacillus dendrobii]MWV46442.1 LD-carboxypeptidase [Paenibacillus dendrobii]